ncbi:hypothetical protein GCM10010387_29340 [Streptomyces inusitatus]|uniref:Uncharacterized protein n=1 Tax=Streptomyces inusitatus TaxID=68221 RepID=A0A918Q464_9ACTN|nr:hypothetical protein GCM10010387_29340 [Streptomyces inusitatus]
MAQLLAAGEAVGEVRVRDGDQSVHEFGRKGRIDRESPENVLHRPIVPCRPPAPYPGGGPLNALCRPAGFSPLSGGTAAHALCERGRAMVPVLSGRVRLGGPLVAVRGGGAEGEQ